MYFVLRSKNQRVNNQKLLPDSCQMCSTPKTHAQTLTHKHTKKRQTFYNVLVNFSANTFENAHTNGQIRVLEAIVEPEFATQESWLVKNTNLCND